MGAKRDSKIRVNEEDKDAIKEAATVMNMQDSPFGAVIREMSNRITDQQKQVVELTADDELLQALK